jgi:two-component system, NtrC family, sensor histidine kinase HydH
MTAIRDVHRWNLDEVSMKVAHDLKNPLTVMTVLVQLGLRNPAEGTSHERLAALERDVTRMREILRDYLSPGHPLEAGASARELGAVSAEAG